MSDCYSGPGTRIQIDTFRTSLSCQWDSSPVQCGIRTGPEFVNRVAERKNRSSLKWPDTFRALVREETGGTTSFTFPMKSVSSWHRRRKSLRSSATRTAEGEGVALRQQSDEEGSHQPSWCTFRGNGIKESTHRPSSATMVKDESVL